VRECTPNCIHKRKSTTPTVQCRNVPYATWRIAYLEYRTWTESDSPFPSSLGETAAAACKMSGGQEDGSPDGREARSRRRRTLLTVARAASPLNGVQPSTQASHESKMANWTKGARRKPQMRQRNAWPCPALNYRARGARIRYQRPLQAVPVTHRHGHKEHRGIIGWNMNTFNVCAPFVIDNDRRNHWPVWNYCYVFLLIIIVVYNCFQLSINLVS